MNNGEAHNDGMGRPTSESVRVIVVLNHRRCSVDAVTCSEEKARSRVAWLVEHYGDPLAASLTFGLVDPDEASQPFAASGGGAS